MEITIRNKENGEQGKQKLPQQFVETVREDLIKRAVLYEQASKRQQYGVKKGAGMRVSATLSRRRRKYRGGYGVGISRVPRKIMSRSGTRFNWVGAEAPGTVGGRRAHGPNSDKIFARKINSKELAKAIRSAITASVDKTLVSTRGHKIPDSFPFILSDDFESIAKTKDFAAALQSLGFTEELDRASIKTIRAGRGKSRGRRYKRRIGPVVVVSSDAKAKHSARNIAGVSVVSVADLTASALAPGTHAGRAALFTTQAIKEMEEKKLFL